MNGTKDQQYKRGFLVEAMFGYEKDIVTLLKQMSKTSWLVDKGSNGGIILQESNIIRIIKGDSDVYSN